MRKPLTLRVGQKPVFVAIILVLLYTLLGVLFFHFGPMHLSWVSAFYFAVTTTMSMPSLALERIDSLSQPRPIRLGGVRQYGIPFTRLFRVAPC